jgi:hypothetical protein
MSAITWFFVCVGCALVGVSIGFIMHKSSVEKVEGDPMVTNDQLDDYAPIVIECELGKAMTLEQMELDVVAPEIIKIMRHFNIKLPNYPSIGMYSKEIFQWYNPDSEYTKLVIVGYLRYGRVKIVWTWVKKDPVYIIDRDAIAGYEDAIKATCADAPIIMCNEEKEESND